MIIVLISSYYVSTVLRTRTWYIGGYLEHGQWYWTTNTRLMSYTNWAPTQPDSEMEACVEMFPVSRLLKWNNRQCYLSRPFICERSLSNTAAIR